MASSPPPRDLDPQILADAVIDAARIAGLGLSVSVTEGDQSQRIHVSETAAAILGYEQHELLGRSVLFTFAPEERARMEAMRQRYQQGGDIPNFIETVALRKDGVRVPIEVAYSWFVKDGRTLTVAFLRDIGERKRAEQALRDSEARVRQIIEAVPDAIFVLREGLLAYTNPAFARLAGYESVDDVLGRAIADFAHPDDRPALASHIAATLATSQTQPAREYRGLRRDGQTIFVEMLLFPFELDTLCVLGVGTDITERKQLQAKVLQTDRMATIGTIAAGVAHEINNPLSYALLNIELLARQLGTLFDDERRRDQAMATLGAIREGSQRVATIVRDLRSFSRGGPDDREYVDIRQVVESSLNIAMSEIRGRARLVRDYAVTPFIRASPARLGQVFLNLVLNAAHALVDGSPDENELRIVIKPLDGERIVVEIVDNGSGMTPDIAARVFEPFFTTKPTGLGVGLGLAICQSIVTSMDGDLTVETAPGKGSTFRVVLPAPAAPKQPSERPEKTPAKRTPLARRCRILIIDDERALGDALGRALAEEHDVAVFAEACQALAFLENADPFDVIICDVVMPRMDGREVYEQLRRSHPHLLPRLIFMTGASAMPKVADFLDRLDLPRVDKPIDIDHLRSLVATIAASAASAKLSC